MTTINSALPKNTSIRKEELVSLLRSACKKTAPVWPLENFVAVNPYMGRINKSFTETAKDLNYLGGIEMTLPLSFYLQKLKEGKILHEDIGIILEQKFNGKLSVNDFITSINNTPTNKTQTQIKIFADIAQLTTKKDWTRLALNRISAWAASYFDNGQAIWQTANQNDSLFISWKNEASIDLSPEISGLKGFRNIIKKLPNNSLEAAHIALKELHIPQQSITLYLEALLLRFGGWAAHAARLDWDSELYGEKDGKLIEFLTILICWEASMLNSLKNELLIKNWRTEIQQWQKNEDLKNENEFLTQKLILQEAFSLSAQKQIINQINNQTTSLHNLKNKIKAQAIFCIDVRSEVFRRNLELVDQEFETIGFAGFFAFPIKFIPLGSQKSEAQCPVLLKTGPIILERMPNEKENEQAINNRIVKHQVKSVWKSFKTGAISCFGFVSPLGISYLPKLFTDSFGVTQPVKKPNNIGLSKSNNKAKTVDLAVNNINNQTVGIPLEQQITMAKNALKAMSLTSNFAKFILIVGHGSTTVNNPHASGLDCGACGGHTGEANAKVAAAVLNNTLVRNELLKENIEIPKGTIFLACLHDTTTDEIMIYNESDVPTFLNIELEEIKNSLTKAAYLTRKERALKMHIKTDDNIDKSIFSRSKDWSQVRPEWGLAGCSTFVVAPRHRTKGVNFNGQSFLHNYDWQKDENFSILELIMTAPMIVTSWINLQYYASTTDNKNYGAGNKTLHNITSGIGVLEGFSGDLRVGLPIQSVHNGENFQHEPLKLTVIIEAPINAMNAMIEKHEMVRNLCDNQWIHLLAMNTEGKVSHRYTGNLKWEQI